jgi:hypothetical protein
MFRIDGAVPPLGATIRTPIELPIIGHPLIIEERVAHVALGGLCPVFDFRQQLGLDPKALLRDLLRIGLRLADQRRQLLMQRLVRHDPCLLCAGNDQFRIAAE